MSWLRSSIPMFDKIKGVICGYRVEDIEAPLCKRYATRISSLTSWLKERLWKRPWDSKTGNRAGRSYINLKMLIRAILTTGRGFCMM